LKYEQIFPKSFITVQSDGVLSLNFPWLRGAREVERLRDDLKNEVVSRLGLTIPEDYERKWALFPVEAWGPKVDMLIESLKTLLTRWDESRGKKGMMGHTLDKLIEECEASGTRP
jgi:hypothetical protein